jgi:hypothetical protein
MRIISLVSLSSVIFWCFGAAFAEPQPTTLSGLQEGQCVLARITGASSSGKEISITLRFDNTDLKDCCWHPEVMVQYTFDCSLAAICRQIFPNPEFKEIERIVVTAFPYPRRDPFELEFTIRKEDWLYYDRMAPDISAKIRLFKALDVKAEGMPFPFKAEEAVDIE